MVSGNASRSLAARGPVRMPMFVALATLLAYLLLYGYSFADGDHDAFLPYLLHMLDPDLLDSDWFVSTQLERIGPRTGFVWLLYWPSKLLGPFGAFTALYVLCWYLISAAVYALSCYVAPDRIAATGAVAALLLVAPWSSFGGNTVIGGQFAPSTAAWALALWSAVMHTRSKPLRAALLCGVATTIQALVGLQMALLLSLMMVWERRSLRSIAIFAATFALTASITVVPQVVQQWSASGSEPSLFYILFEFRAPHHYIVSQFRPRSTLVFAGTVVLAMVCLAALTRKQRLLPVRIWIITGLFCLAGFLGTDLFRSEFLGKLQLFHATVFAKVLLVIVICAAISRILPRIVHHSLDRFFDYARYALAGTILVAAALLVASPRTLGLAPARVTSASPVPEQIAEWAKAESPLASVFAVPPSWDGFRSRAHRAIVVNFKAVPFAAPYTVEWYERLMALAPIPETGEMPVSNVQAQLDDAFFALPTDDVRRLASQYGFDHIVRKASLRPPPSDFEAVFRAGGLTTYRIQTP